MLQVNKFLRLIINFVIIIIISLLMSPLLGHRHLMDYTEQRAITHHAGLVRIGGYYNYKYSRDNGLSCLPKQGGLIAKTKSNIHQDEYLTV
jgi:hypothetical protein